MGMKGTAFLVVAPLLQNRLPRDTFLVPLLAAFRHQGKIGPFRQAFNLNVLATLWGVGCGEVKGI